MKTKILEAELKGEKRLKRGEGRKSTSARDWDLSAAVSAIDGHGAATTHKRGFESVVGQNSEKLKRFEFVSLWCMCVRFWVKILKSQEDIINFYLSSCKEKKLYLFSIITNLTRIDPYDN